MPRIVGVEVPKEKRIEVSLCYIYGIGQVMSGKILLAARIDPNKRAKDLTDEEVSRLSQAVLATTKVEGDLRRDVSSNIKRLIDIGSYRGLRHKRGLPVRGQRSRTNARSRKGPRPRVGVRKKTKPPVAGARSSS
ncbi:MAG: 30S ribosomal protein S13 [Candidatus Omnitrophica bacterium]|nr:30S ribosomal protein S13 [Candidatus Omnitrophota bacterium]MBI2174686.1 30S ribosomal protein S13 [Candidatus Omnitrophota bacterium]